MWHVWTAWAVFSGRQQVDTPVCWLHSAAVPGVRGGGGGRGSGLPGQVLADPTPCSLLSFVRNCQSILQPGCPLSHCHQYPAAPCPRQHLLGTVLRVLAILTGVWLCVLLFTSPFLWGHASWGGGWHLSAMLARGVYSSLRRRQGLPRL